jgi:hypothetical protein
MKMQIQMFALALALASGVALAGGHHGTGGSGGFWIASGTEAWGEDVKVGNAAHWDAEFNHGEDKTFGFSGGWSTMSEGQGFQDVGGMGWGMYDWDQHGSCGGFCGD